MQAYKLRIAQGYHTHVVKVCVEPRSNCAAFLLADSTCLLVSLTSSGFSHPALVPAPCTDACFVRLLVRLPVVPPTLRSSRHSRTEGNSGGVSNSAGQSWNQQHGKVGDLGRGDGGATSTGKEGERKGRGRGVVVGDGKGVNGTAGGRVLFLTTQPGQGGSCTDVCAWLCEPPLFRRTLVELDVSGQANFRETSNELLSSKSVAARGRYAARLDIPHGMAVKMVASVNVVVLYFISVGKFWIMAAKYVEEQKMQAEFDNKDASLPSSGRKEEGIFDGNFVRKAEHLEPKEGSTREYVSLIKCAVLDCTNPVYSLHVSMQHLIIGESGGVRIWPLRPLIKPVKRQIISDGIRNEIQNLNVDKLPPLSLQGNNVSTGKGQVNRAPKQTSLGSESVVDVLCNGHASGLTGANAMVHLFNLQGKESNTVPSKVYRKNGLHEDVNAISDPRFALNRDEVVLLQSRSRNGMYGVLESMDKEKSVSKLFLGEPGMGMREVPAQENELEELEVQQNGKNPESPTSKFVQGGDWKGVTDETDSVKAQTQLKYTESAEFLVPQENEPHPRLNGEVDRTLDAKVIQKQNDILLHSGNKLGLVGNMEPSSSETVSALQFPNLKSTVLSLQSTSVVEEKITSTPNQAQDVGLIQPLFVPISDCSNPGGVMSAGEVLQLQIVDVQEFSSRRFAVLDVRGCIHLLILDIVQEKRAGATPIITNPRMICIGSPMKVGYMAVLVPSVQATPAEIGPLRRLWISDGQHSNYVITLSEDGALPASQSAKTSNTGGTSVLPYKVTESVFINERICSLISLSAQTVLVVTQGTITAYVVPGS